MVFAAVVALLNPVYKPLSSSIREKLEVQYSGYMPILGGQTGNAVATIFLTMAPQPASTVVPIQDVAPTPISGQKTPSPPPTTPPTSTGGPIPPPNTSGGNGDAGGPPTPPPTSVPAKSVPASASPIGARMSLVDFELVFNGFKLPITQENARKFFPGTTFDFDPSGKVLKAVLPNVHVPFRLPGLDLERIPELSFLPIQFPSGGVELGKPFHNHVLVSGNEIDLEVTAQSQSGNLISFSFSRSERYTVLEDASNSVVPDKRDAVNQVETAITGTGTATFDTEKGRFTSVVSHDLALGRVTNLSTRTSSIRRLRRVLTLTAP